MIKNMFPKHLEKNRSIFIVGFYMPYAKSLNDDNEGDEHGD